MSDKEKIDQQGYCVNSSSDCRHCFISCHGWQLSLY